MPKWIRYGIGASVLWVLFVLMGEEELLGYLGEASGSDQNLLMLVGGIAFFIASWAFTKRNK